MLQIILFSLLAVPAFAGVKSTVGLRKCLKIAVEEILSAEAFKSRCASEPVLRKLKLTRKRTDHASYIVSVDQGCKRPPVRYSVLTEKSDTESCEITTFRM